MRWVEKKVLGPQKFRYLRKETDDIDNILATLEQHCIRQSGILLGFGFTTLVALSVPAVFVEALMRRAELEKRRWEDDQGDTPTLLHHLASLAVVSQAQV